VEAILTGAFMNVTCPSCRKVLKPEFPFTIFNKNEGWELRFVPELLRQETMKHPPKGQGPKFFRLVIGYSELLEKIKVLEEKLDDRVIEYLKYFILSKVLEKTETEENDIDVIFHEKSNNQLTFHIQGLKNEEVGIFKIPLATYTKALAEIDKHATEKPFSEFLSPPYISLNKLYSWDDV
jgi:hypothetical protein